jgi:peptide-methionine (R)-S-oxide reductase
MHTNGRRPILVAGASTLGLAMAGIFGINTRSAQAGVTEVFEVTHTDAEWRKLLDHKQYAILRKEDTERPFTSPLNEEHRPGRFSCAGCKLDLFSSKTKFDSGTGWPSFWQPLDNAVANHKDTSLGMDRDEVHCRRCGGHLGHVFDDGPKPTGLRYCLNGFAMRFTSGVV